MSCKKCGKCCEAIILAQSPESIKYMINNGNSSFAFAARNFKPITREQALTINPYLKLWKLERQDFYYTCKQFCHTSRTCMSHAIRPDVCSSYPYYGRKVIPLYEKFYSETCGYKNPIINLIKKRRVKNHE